MRLLRPVQQPLYFFDIDFGGRMVFMPHHLLHPHRIRIIEEGKGGTPQDTVDK